MRLALPFALAWLATIALACAESDNLGLNAGKGGGASDGGPTSDAASDAPRACTPGQQIACACPGGAPGAQACNHDGTGYDACVCPDAGAGGAGGTGGSAGAGGSGGASGSGGAAGGGGSGGASGGGGSSGAGGAGGSGGVGGAGGTAGGGGSAGSGGTAGSAGSGGAGGSGGSSGSGGAAGGTGNADVCPGKALTLVNDTVTVNDDTSQYASDYSGWCSTPGTGGNVVYQVVAPKTGTMTVSVTPSGFSAVVAYSAGACSPSGTADCRWGVQIDAQTTLQFSASAGATYWIFLDGYSLSGPFSMTISM